jgi:hypothetical protein
VADEHEKGDEEIVRGQHERAPLTSDDPLVEPGEDPFAATDLSGIHADDALLDALGGANPDPNGELVEDELNALLLSWRQEVDSEPVTELVDTDTAVATIAAARHRPRPRHRFLIPLATAAAVLAIVFTGMSLVARDAQPGDSLWGLTRVLYSEHARSIEAAVAVRTDLDSARAALREGRIDDAKQALEKATVSLPSVSSDDGKAELAARHDSLMEQLTSTEPQSPNPLPGGNSSSSAMTTSPSTPPSTTGSTAPSSPSSETSSPPSSSTGTPSPSSSSSTPPASASSNAGPPDQSSDGSPAVPRSGAGPGIDPGTGTGAGTGTGSGSGTGTGTGGN